MCDSPDVLIERSEVKRIKKIIGSLLLANDLAVGKTMDPALLAGFLTAIRPLRTNHELIRVGGESDGGYLVPDDLAGVEYCFSPGVSNTADFEDDLTKRGIRCFLADYSVDGPPISNELFDFEKKFLGPEDTDVFTTLQSWVDRKAAGKMDLILQMDIEGGEYEVLFDTSSLTLRRFRILVIEFHDLHKLCQKDFFRLASLGFRKLLKDFDIVHVHPNNCSPPRKYKTFELPPVMEFTFHRKDRIAWKSPAATFPHELDRKNVPSNPDYGLPSCWYSGD